MKMALRHQWTCTVLLAIFCLQTGMAQNSFPSFSHFSKPSPGPSAPGDNFSPNIQGGIKQESPEVAEWTRSAGPDQSLVLTGSRFSSFSGVEEGKDSRFTVFASDGSLKDASIQRIDNEKAIITLPADLPKWSMYLLWPSNDAGYGRPIAINKTEAWWVGPDRAFAGSSISVFGRNLSKNNDTTAAHVYVKAVESTFGKWAQIKRVNPYKVDFVVPEDLPAGTYEVWAHNGHGGEYGWSHPVQITIVEKNSWINKNFNVKDFGAKGDGFSDDVNAIRTAIAEAKKNPGSTIYFPAGTYMVSGTLEAGNNIRWKGDGKDRTIIKCANNFSTASYGLLFGNVNNFEVNDMGFDGNKNFRGTLDKAIFLRGSSNVKINNAKFSFQGFGIMDLHHCKYIFLNNVDHIGAVLFLGNCSQLFIDYNNFRLTDDTDHILHSWAGSCISMTNSTCADLDNSNPNNGEGWGKGRFFVGQGAWGSNNRTYLGHNTTKDLAPRAAVDQNSGEQFLWEGNFGVWAGNSANATLYTASLNGFSNPENSPLIAVIIKGKGFGQSRRIVATKGSEITVDEPWNVLPDATSYIVVGKFVDKVAIYGNYLDGKAFATTAAHGMAVTGIEPFGGASNFIADNNTLHELRQGIHHWSTEHETGIDPTYFSLYANNKIISCRSAIVNVAGSWRPFPSVMGTMIRNNEIINAVESGITNDMNTSSFPVLDATVFEKNIFKNVPNGNLNKKTGLQNQVFYRNNFQGPLIGKQTSPKLSLRENQFNGYRSVYEGNFLEAVIEAPFHVVEVFADDNRTLVQKDFTIWNNGSSVMNWTAASLTPWLSISQNSGQILDEKSGSIIGLVINPKNLSAGIYKGYFTVNSSGKVRTYSVVLHIREQTIKENILPIVSLKASDNKTVFTAPASVQLLAEAADSDGTVAKVEFYQGSTKVGEDLSAPYTFSVSSLAAGSYAFTARAIDNDGAAATSQSATITVNAPAKVAPKVSVSTSQTLATQVAHASFKLMATATDSDGIITLVEFFNGTQKIGEDNSAPYEMTWSNIAAGSYSITAKATDNDGLTATSSVLSLSVQAAPQAPSVALTAPTTGANFTAPATISIAANATDNDGAIVRVEFFVNGNKIGEDTTAPYAFAWSNVVVGNYTITAKATDNSNLSATSTSVSITVAEKPNVAPVVSLIAPAAAQTFTAPATIDLSATATDSDGTISKVEFFANGNKIGEDLTAPYTFQWIGVAQGTYTITVKATDNKGAMSTSQAVQVLVNPAPVAKVAPKVSLTTPTTNSTFTAPANVTLQASAADTDGTVAKVEFYQGSTKISEDITAPYTFTLSGLTAGTYSYTAKAIDNDGLNATSAAVNVMVNAAPVAPVVAITAPVAGTSFTAPSTINIAANATDADGTISLVEFFANGNKIGAATAAPYSMSWTNVATGNYSITVKATDNSGLSTVSGNTAITVNAPLKTAPAISVTATSVTANVIAPATIKIAATATDNDGTVAKVEFFNGTQKIGEDLAAPFEMTWSNVAAGIYNITAKATDNDGLSNTSSSVSIVVKPAPVAPVVTLASSASSIAAPASVTLTANATDADGSIVKVEFFSAGKKLGEATRAPFQYKWTMSQAGTYTVTAKATDNNGLTATSEVVTIIATKKNQAPEVSLTKTQGGKTGLSSLAESVSLLALASDPDGSITKVEFFNNGVKVGETATSPYVYEVKNLQPGVHNFTAKATDDGGMSTVSQVVALSVSKPAPVAPVVSLGANKTAANTGEKITLSAKASDSDGSVAKVEFFNGNTKLGEDQTAPFEWTAQFAAAGVYKITAKATDNSGMTATSNVVTLTVTTPQVAPVVDLIDPIANSVYVLPTTVSVAANATDKDGAVAKVEFFANGEKIGESKTAPFRIDWKPQVAGTYQITAKATDNQGLTSTAAAVLVTVQMSNTANQPGHIKSYPNPFSNQATLEVAVQAKSYVVAQLIAPSGQVITNIHQGILEPGLVHKFNLNGTGLPNGAYIVAIKLNDGVTFFDKMIYQKVVIAR